MGPESVWKIKHTIIVQKYNKTDVSSELTRTLCWIGELSFGLLSTEACGELVIGDCDEDNRPAKLAKPVEPGLPDILTVLPLVPPLLLLILPPTPLPLPLISID